MSEFKKVHILSNSPKQNSGFSVVASNLAVQLKKLGHDVAMTGMQDVGTAIEYEGVTVYPIIGDFNECTYPELLLQGLRQNIQMQGADTLICVHPPDLKHDFFLKAHKNTIWYTVLDEEMVYRNHPTLRNVRTAKNVRVVIMTHCAGAQLDKQGIENNVIYPGHDPAKFHTNFDKKCQDRVTFYIPAEHKEIIFSAGQIPEFWKQLGIEFLIGFAGQNNGVRKRIELLIEAFSIFAKDKGKEVHLHLHTLPNYITGINLIEMLHYFNITDRVTFSYGLKRSSGWSEESLNILYNTFDIFATASSGGGFELTNFESAVVGVPQVCPDVMPFNELFPDVERGLLARGRRQFIQSGAYRFLVDPEDLAAKMQIMYENRQLRDKLGRNCKEWAQQYTWARTGLEFNKIL